MQLKINPALIAALEHYGEVRYDWKQPTLFRYTDETGHQSDWGLERTCSLAAKTLATQEIAQLELRVLKDGLKQHGAEFLYERITRRKLT